MKDRLRDIAARCETPVERRLLAEYGAVFVTQATPPPTILFQDAAEVEGFQASLRGGRGGVRDGVTGGGDGGAAIGGRGGRAPGRDDSAARRRRGEAFL